MPNRQASAIYLTLSPEQKAWIAQLVNALLNQLLGWGYLSDWELSRSCLMSNLFKDIESAL